MPTTHAPVYLPAPTLAAAEATLASRENLLLLAQRSGDAHAIEQATYRRDFAAVAAAKLRAGR